MRPDPIAALAEAWGREIDAYDDTASCGNPAGRAIGRHEAAIAKRARRAAKRAEDERRTAAGRATYTPPAKLGFQRTGWFTGWSARLAQWDGAPYAIGEPRWRIRSRERRANPALYMRDRGAL